MLGEVKYIIKIIFNHFVFFFFLTVAIRHIQVMYETHVIFLWHTLWKRNRKQLSIARAQSSGGEGERWRRMNRR